MFADRAAAARSYPPVIRGMTEGYDLDLGPRIAANRACLAPDARRVLRTADAATLNLRPRPHREVLPGVRRSPKQDLRWLR
jgi:hypothetical protein